MAMPYMEKAANPTEWLNNLVEKTQIYPKASKKLVYEFIQNHIFLYKLFFFYSLLHNIV
jgi:hypothetical protein